MTRTFSIAIAFATLVVASTTASAQESARDARPRVGAFWSANFASVSLTPAVEGVTGRQWVGGGLTVEVPMTPRQSVEARAYWNRRGARLPVPGTTGY